MLTVRVRYLPATRQFERELLRLLYNKSKNKYKLMVDEEKTISNMCEIENALYSCKAAWSLVNNNRGPPRLNFVSCGASPDDFNNFLPGKWRRLLRPSLLVDSNPANLVMPCAVGLVRWNWVIPDVIIKVVYRCINVVAKFKASHGPDIYIYINGMATLVLKAIIDVVAQPLALLINHCLKEGIFLDIFKTARSVPIYKKGDPSNLVSYRPLRVIPVFGKIS